MARTRYLKLGFFHNEALCELEPLTRLLFAGLICLADREGRLEDRPRKIRALIFPYEREANVEVMLGKLAAAGFILRYNVNDEGYVQIVNFTKHQHPHPKEPFSGFPAPPDDAGREKPRQIPASSGNAGASTCESPFPSFPSYPSLTVCDSAKPPSHTQARKKRATPDGVVCVSGSLFSLEECREYAESIAEIRNPVGFAKSIQRSGLEDHAIEAFLAGQTEGDNERRKRIARRIEARRAHRDN
jgi:hypothetical protein